MGIPLRLAPDEMIRAERRALLWAVTAKAVREADREVVCTRRADRMSDFREQSGKTYARSEPYRFLPQRSFGSIHSTCLSAFVTDRAMEAWYHPPLHE